MREKKRNVHDTDVVNTKKWGHNIRVVTHPFSPGFPGHNPATVYLKGGVFQKY